MGTVRRTSVSLLAGLVVLSPGLRAQTTQIPIPTRIEVPMRGILMHVEAEARLRVTIDAGRVTEVRIAKPGLDANMDDFVRGSAEIYFGQWRWEDTASGSFETTLRVRFDRDRIPCRNDPNAVVNIALPTLIEFVTTPIMLCNWAERTRVVAEPVVTRLIAGHVLCECPGRAPITGAGVRLLRGTDVVRNARTDGRGYFRLGGVSPGTYRLEVGSTEDHDGLAMPVVLSEQAAAETLDLAVVPGPPRPPIPPGPEASVTSAVLADYPADARARGLQGEVRLRLSMNGTVVDVDVDSNVPELAAAAEANVRTWEIHRAETPVLLVTYTYRLLPGDCGPDQQPAVSMRFPHSVEVKAKRPIRCTP